jgi:hypothetical protein
MPFRLLVDAVMEPARRHFRSMFLAIALPLGIAALVMVGVQIRWLEGVQPQNGIDMLNVIGPFLGVLVIFFAVYYLCFAVTIVAATDAVFGREVNMRRAWLFVLAPRRLPTLCLLAFLGVLSFMACGLPALYVIPVLSFSLPAMLEEGAKGGRALGRSIELARYNPRGRFKDLPWAQMLGILFIGWVISSAIASLVQLPFVAIQQILAVRQALEGNLAPSTAVAWLQVPTSLFGILATTVSWVYMAFGIAVLYREVRRRKEGEDIEAAVNGLLSGPGSGGESGGREESQ